MIKKNLHPLLYNTKIFCDGIHILTLQTTKKELFIDIWSGNHPFYTNTQRILDLEGRIEKFNKKYKNYIITS